jgi:hypothetical protein
MYTRKVEVNCVDLENLQGCLVHIRETAEIVNRCLRRFAKRDYDALNIRDVDRIIAMANEALAGLAQYHPDRRQTDGSDDS